MRSRPLRRSLLAAALISTLGACGATPHGPVRGPVDPVGYTHSADGIARVVRHASGLEWPGRAAPPPAAGPLVGAIAPHDDYAYAERVAVHAYPGLTARDVILIGVAHKARQFPEVEGQLVFDSYAAWRGPYGPIAPSPLREALRARLGADAIVHDRLQAVEHSVEGLVPLLQHFRRDVRIVSILVPYMSFERLSALADRTGAALAAELRARGLALGPDVAILVSADLVHYGDEGWGPKPHAPFGVDRGAYKRAVARDRALIRDHLEGPIDRARLGGLFRALVEEDPHEYRITWCGRFSIPFGVALMGATAAALGRPAPAGTLRRYGTTLDPGRSDPGVPGLGVTAPASLRHWVGFAAIAYR
jgi:AmmeMemoRadiSam system protein B